MSASFLSAANIPCRREHQEKIMNKLILAIPAFLLLAGCTWVQLTSAGEGVRVATVSGTASCTRVGRAHVQTMSKVTFVERGGDKQRKELIVLARNEAADLGGNTIVPESQIVDGEQTFGVFRCP